MVIKSLSNYACLYTTDFQSNTKSNGYISHLNYVQLYETLHLNMAAHFQKVTETGPSLKQVLLVSYDIEEKLILQSYAMKGEVSPGRGFSGALHAENGARRCFGGSFLRLYPHSFPYSRNRVQLPSVVIHLNRRVSYILVLILSRVIYSVGGKV